VLFLILMNPTLFINHLAFISYHLKQGVVQKISQPSPEGIYMEWRAFGKNQSLLLSLSKDLDGFFINTPRKPSTSNPGKFLLGVRKRIIGAKLLAIKVPSNPKIQMAEWVFNHKNYGIVILRIKFDPPHRDLKIINEESQVIYSLLEPKDENKIIPAFDGVEFDFQEPSHEIIQDLIESGKNFEDELERNKTTREYKEAIHNLKTSEKKFKKILNRIISDQNKMQLLAQHEQRARILQANLYQLDSFKLDSKKDQRIQIERHDSREPLEIIIPSGKTPAQFMEILFNYSKKGKRGLKEITKRKSWCEHNLSCISDSLEKIEALPPSEKQKRINIINLLDPEIINKFKPPQSKNKEKAKQKKKLPSSIRKFTSRKNEEIFVGMSADGNEEIIKIYSKPWDHWFHILGVPGSHVLLKSDKKKSITPESVIDAAVLAVFYSSLKKSPKGDVQYTQRKHIKKPKKSKKGQVIVSQGKSIYINLETTHKEVLQNILKFTN